MSRVHNHRRQRFWPSLGTSKNFCSGYARCPIRAVSFEWSDPTDLRCKMLDHHELIPVSRFALRRGLVEAGQI
jgi:hypothetical protein